MIERKVLRHAQANLPIFRPPRQKTFRAAVAKVIRDLKAEHSLTNVELAETIGCCPETISNAENEHNDLRAVLLLCIAFHFGEEAIAPVRQLYLRNNERSAPTLVDRLRALLEDIET